MKITRKPKFEETHVRFTSWADKEVVKSVNKICGDEKGAKVEFVNRAFRSELERMGVRV